MDLELDGRVYIVTGGSRGLGLAAAQALTAEGARVVLTGLSETVSDAASPGSTAGSSTTNTSNFGTAAVELVPPYVTLAYIIRIA